MRSLPHALIGAACGIGLDTLAGGNHIELIAAAIAGASLPDNDLKLVNRRLPHPRPGAPCKLLEHRGPFHSVTAAAILGGLLVSAGLVWIGVALAVGFVSHLVADGISYMGVPYLWPITSRRFRLLPRGLRLASGSLLELPIALSIATLTYWVAFH